VGQAFVYEVTPEHAHLGGSRHLYLGVFLEPLAR
jgi:hypothetical protein